MWGVSFAASLLSLFSSTGTHCNVLVCTDSNHLIQYYLSVYQMPNLKYNNNSEFALACLVKSA